MKWLLRILFIASLAVGLTLLAKYIDGYVVLVSAPYRIDLSLSLMIILLIALTAAAYALWRLASYTLRFPDHVKTFKQERRRVQGQEALSAALMAYHEGRYSDAESFAVTAADLGIAPTASLLLAARAAHAGQAYGKRDEYLKLAQNIDPGAQLACWLTEAQLAFESGDVARAQRALNNLPEPEKTRMSALLSLPNPQLQAYSNSH